MNFWAFVIIFIVGLIYTNIGIEMLGSNPFQFKGQSPNLTTNNNQHIENVEPQVNVSTNLGAPEVQNNIWECKNCSYINKGSSKYCANCGNGKESSLQ